MYSSMGKQNITVSLDHELVHELRQQGQISQTINTLLQKHLFDANTKEGIQKLINEKKDELGRLQNDIEVLEKKLKEKPKLVVRHV